MLQAIKRLFSIEPDMSQRPRAMLERMRELSDANLRLADQVLAAEQKARDAEARCKLTHEEQRVIKLCEEVQCAFEELPQVYQRKLHKADAAAVENATSFIGSLVMSRLAARNDPGFFLTAVDDESQDDESQDDAADADE